MTPFVDVLTTAVLTYASHSAAACVLALLAARFISRPHDRDLVWKAAFVAPLITAAAAAARSVLAERGTYVDLGIVAREWSPRLLPARRIIVRVTEDADGLDVLRQVIDPVTSALSILVLVAATACVVVALARFARRRRALRRALAPRHLSTELLPLAGGRVARVTTVPDLPSPVALGDDEVCLPDEVMHTFAPEHRRALMAHEAAHLERRDPRWFLLAEILGVATAFQPLIFLVIRAFRRDAELICDESAVRATRDAPSLIGALALLAAPFDPRAPLEGAVTAHDGSPLVARARRIALLTRHHADDRVRRATMLVVASLVAVLCAVPTVSAAPRASDYPLDPFGGLHDAHFDRHPMSAGGYQLSERRTIVIGR